MIADDTISKTLMSLAALLTVYLVCLENTLSLVLTPVILLLVGDYLQRKTLKTVSDKNSIVGDGPQVEATRKKILAYTLVGVVAISLSGIAITSEQVRQQFNVLSVTGLLSFSVLMAIAEESVFRRWATNFFVLKMNVFGHIASAAFFAVYHLGRYPEISSLLYVFCGGLILSLIAWHSGRASPAMLAHIINNVSATTDLSSFLTFETAMLIGAITVLYVVIKSLEKRRK